VSYPNTGSLCNSRSYNFQINLYLYPITFAKCTLHNVLARIWGLVGTILYLIFWICKYLYQRHADQSVDNSGLAGFKRWQCQKILHVQIHIKCSEDIIFWTSKHSCQIHATRSVGTGWQRPIGCLICIGQFPRISPRISGSFAKRDLQLKASYASSRHSKCWWCWKV